MAADPTGISSSDPGPQQAASDGQSAAAYPLSEQIARARFLSQNAAVQTRSKRGFFGFGKFIAAGPAPDQQGTLLGGIGGFGNANSLGF